MKECIHTTDESLVRLAVQGDRAAFDEVVRRYCKPLVEFAKSRTATFHDAEDIAQETLLRAYRHLASYDDTYPFRSWLFTIAYRLIVTGYRKKKPVRLSAQVADRLQAQLPACTGEHDWLWQVVETLPVDDGIVLWLRYKQEMSIPDIAHVTGKTKLSVRVRLHRARNKLAELINESRDQADLRPLTNTLNVKGID